MQNRSAPAGLKQGEIIVATGKKVLIVDDEKDVLTYLKTLFEDHGYETVLAEDGKAGMEKARTEKPDLISLDISMPEESGVKMFRDLQDDEELASIPVVIITGLSSDFKRFIDYLEKRKQLKPPAAYFEKPIDRDDLIAKVNGILG